MRISDWSSDVCSSDLHAHSHRCEDNQQRIFRPGNTAHREKARRNYDGYRCCNIDQQLRKSSECIGLVKTVKGRSMCRRQQQGDARSEEHTSELQSLMRISYAVFCLKKKKKTTNKNHKKTTIHK